MMDGERSLLLLCRVEKGWEPIEKAGAETRGKGDGAHHPFPLCPVLQVGPGSISRCGPRTASGAASLQATAFAMCPAARAPTSWTAPHGGRWAAGGSSWPGPLWVVGRSCCMRTPSTVGLTATVCTQPLVARFASSSACCCVTSTATALSAEGSCSNSWPSSTALAMR